MLSSSSMPRATLGAQAEASVTRKCSWPPAGSNLGAGIPWVENRCQACLHWLGNLSASGEGSRRQPQASTRQKYRDLAGDDRLHAKTGDTTELPKSLQQFHLEIPPTIKFSPRSQTPDRLKRSLTERERSVLQLQQVTISEAL